MISNWCRVEGWISVLFFQLLVRQFLNYEFIGHIQTRKSVEAKDATVDKLWYQFLLENLLGGESGSMADNILATMKEDTSIGMVFPDDPNVVSWGDNRVRRRLSSGALGY